MFIATFANRDVLQQASDQITRPQILTIAFFKKMLKVEDLGLN